MSNPAWALDALLESWSFEGQNRVWKARGGGPNHEFWRRQASAVALVRQVELAIDGLEASGARVKAFRDSLDAWYAAVFAPDRNWNERVGGPMAAIDPASRQLLQALGSLLDASYIPDGDPDRNAVRAALEAAEDLVKSEPTLPAAGRAYLLGLIRQTYTYLDDVDEFGASTLRAATHTIAGALHTAADSGVIPPERTPAWRKAAAAVGIIVVLPTLAIVAERGVDKVLPAGPQTVIEQPANPAPDGP